MALSERTTPSYLRYVLKTAYLTIDDGPTDYTPRLLSELKRRGIPAVLFFIGERMESRQSDVISAIQQGFVVGNHSWSHPHFNDISFAEAKAEISKTEALIDQFYEQAKVKRRAKYFRFPYGDAGDGRKGKLGLFNIAWSGKKGRQIQQYLRDEGFQGPSMPDLSLDELWRSKLAKRIDWSWSFDVMEWSTLLEKPVAKIADTNDVLARLQASGPADPRKPNRKDHRWLDSPASEIILLHDDPASEHTVQCVLDVFSQLPLQFVTPLATPEPR